MLTFKVTGSKVTFYCGNNVLGTFEVATVKLVNPTRLAAKLRDFGSIADRVLVISIAQDFVVEAGV